MLIREIILENFMSYEYSRIPLKPGVNVICGPNGSGKSSILLGISVALGQSYTERSKRLSDLIRWGKDVGRVTLILDNSKRNGRRPVPRIKKDEILLTRVLRSDGKYWFELDNKSVTKNDVQRVLSRFGVDPENMLIIMHQNMAEQFVVLSPQEKLKMVEAAVGLEPYRRNVIQAQKKLSRILSQEESVKKLLESAEQTLSYWREQYERYQEKKQLMLKRRFLERELAWAQVLVREDKASELQRRIESIKDEINDTETRIKISKDRLESLQRDVEGSKDTLWKLLEQRIMLEGDRARYETAYNLLKGPVKEIQSLTESIKADSKEVNKFVDRVELLVNSISPLGMDRNLQALIDEVASSSRELRDRLNRIPSILKVSDLEGEITKSIKRKVELDGEISKVQDGIEQLRFKVDELNNQIIDERVNLALLQYRIRGLNETLRNMEKEYRGILIDLEAAVKRAEETGPRIATTRNVDEILDEIRVVDGRIAALADVSEDIERMYESYSKLYLELKEKARVVEENREKALREVKDRIEAWRNVINNLLDSVNEEYGRILSKVAATGSVHLVNSHDIESAGLEILVGFKGAKPVPLNIYTQSGGERSTATVAFLIALQQHVRSPFRAIDEYDIHLDPRSREILANVIISSVRGGQFLIITPSQITLEQEDVNVIVVQNVEGSSVIRVLS